MKVNVLLLSVLSKMRKHFKFFRCYQEKMQVIVQVAVLIFM